jgi:hypothetical protein
MAGNAVRKERCSAHYLKNIKTVFVPADCVIVEAIVSLSIEVGLRNDR